MITLDRNALLGGGVSPRETLASKIGEPKNAPPKASEIALDVGLLLVRGDQGHGAKIGDKNLTPPSATGDEIALETSVLLGRSGLGQAAGAKIGGKDWAPPSAADGNVALETTMLLGRNGLGQAAGAKIGGKDMAPPSAKAGAVALDRTVLLGHDGQAAGAKIGVPKE